MIIIAIIIIIVIDYDYERYDDCDQDKEKVFIGPRSLDRSDLWVWFVCHSLSTTPF